MTVILPTYKGWTVDYRLKEFRKVNYNTMSSIEFMSFDSPEGDELLAEMIRKDLIPMKILVELF